MFHTPGENRSLKMIDLGLAQGGLRDGESMTEMKGTIAYMPPEMLCRTLLCICCRRVKIPLG